MDLHKGLEIEYCIYLLYFFNENSNLVSAKIAAEHMVENPGNESYGISLKRQASTLLH